MNFDFDPTAPVDHDPNADVWSIRALSVIGVLVAQGKVDGEAAEALGTLIALAPTDVLMNATALLMSVQNVNNPFA